MVTTVLAFLLALGVLVTFHEFGHYWVARRMGVKVLRFSIGFGPAIVKWQRGETEWAIAPVPLGGYVRMLDSREGEVAPTEMHRAFDQQTVWRRVAIVAAGPVANLLLAVVLVWVTLLNGTEGLRPGVGRVVPGSPAAVAGLRAGQEVESINGQPVHDWQELRLALVEALTDRGEPLVIKVSDGGVTRTLQVPVGRIDGGSLERGMAGFGVSPARPTTEAGFVLPGSAAEQAGIQVGDRLVALDGMALDGDWEKMVAAVQASQGRPLQVTLQRRDGGRESVTLTPRQDAASGEWKIGLASQPDRDWMQSLRYVRHVGPVDAIGMAVAQTWQTSALTLKMMGRMLTGAVSPSNISGPITMADFAGKSARAGWESFVDYMALISISLGILNLLPIPLLDGGHLLYYAAEIIRGRPLSMQVQDIGRRIGLAALLLLMSFALFNDITRLFAG